MGNTDTIDRGDLIEIVANQIEIDIESNRLVRLKMLLHGISSQRLIDSLPENKRPKGVKE